MLLKPGGFTHVKETEMSFVFKPFHYFNITETDIIE